MYEPENLRSIFHPKSHVVGKVSLDCGCARKRVELRVRSAGELKNSTTSELSDNQQEFQHRRELLSFAEPADNQSQTDDIS